LPKRGIALEILNTSLIGLTRGATFEILNTSPFENGD